MELGYYNHQFVEIDGPVVPLQDRGYQYGDGIYEVVRVYGGVPFMLAEHLDRLERSARAIRLTLPCERARLEELIAEGLTRAGLAEAQVYLQVSRGVAPRAHPFPKGAEPILAMTFRKAALPAEAKLAAGAAVLLREDERWANCWIKTLNLLPNVLAKQEAIDAGLDDAVLVREGVVTEGSSCNIFAVSGGELHTHPTTRNILAGVVRLAVLELACELEIPVREQPFSPTFLASADEIFLTSTTIELLPVSRLAGMVHGAPRRCPGPLTMALLEAYRARRNGVAAKA